MKRKKPIILLGAGSHARVVLDMLLEQNCEVLGLTDANAALWGTLVFGVPVLGDDACISRYVPSNVELVNGIGSIASTRLHQQVYENAKRLGYKFANVIHASAVMSSRCTFGEGLVVMAGTVINAGTCVENNVIVNTRASIDHGCHIASHVHIAPGCVLSGNVFIGEGTHLGTGSVAIQGVHVGANVLVGAGTLVLHDIAEGTSVYGVPAKEVTVL